MYVRYFRGLGYDVVHTHIRDNGDFFALDVPDVDYIISNPPYSCKTDVLERLFKLDIPFAMLVGVVGLFESQRRFEMFRDHEFEIMYLDRRVNYYRSYADSKPMVNPPFSSAYVCHRLLPSQIVFEQITRD